MEFQVWDLVRAFGLWVGFKVEAPEFMVYGLWLGFGVKGVGNRVDDL